MARLFRKHPTDALLKAAFVKLEAYRVKAAARVSIDARVSASAGLVPEMRYGAREAGGVRPLPDMLRLGEGVPLGDEIVETQSRLDHLREGIARLKGRNAEAFRLHRIEGMSYRQIAHRLNIPVRSVERHVAEAALFLACWMESR